MAPDPFPLRPAGGREGGREGGGEREGERERKGGRGRGGEGEGREGGSDIHILNISARQVENRDTYTASCLRWDSNPQCHIH